MFENLTFSPFIAAILVPAFASVLARDDERRMSEDTIEYVLRFPAPPTHYVEIEASFPAGGPHLDLMMAVWTPGSYLVREYARHVENVAAHGPDGRSLRIQKLRKNRWRVETSGSKRVRLTYRVYGREMSARTNWIESGFALLNGAPTFITLADTAVSRPHLVTLELPDAWKTSVSALPSVAGAPHHYRAGSFDELVDSPILLGNPALHTFEVDGKEHLLVNQGEAGVWDGARAVRDVERIVATARQFWGELPYGRYVFFNLISEASGGLEHANSCVLLTSRWSTSTRKAYLGWLTLAAHEHFHVWNVKRLRPAELGPFDYENEVYTRGLWVAEGLSSYYEHLLVRRAGLTTEPELLEGLSTDIRELQTTPGRLQQSIETASFDAWIKLYRPDENSPNSSISYYTKGSVIGFLLDARIRQATGGEKSLDDVLRLAGRRFSGTRGFSGDEFRDAVHEAAGTDFGDWWHTALETASELEYDEALECFGLRFKPASDGAGKASIGATTKIDNGRLVVSQVRRGTPAHDAGLNVDDEILAIGDFRVRPDQLATRLESYRPDEEVSILVARRDLLTRVVLTLGREPQDTWCLEVRPDITPEQQQRLKAWQGDA
jgi:predicted metalloprotease with PDZ domain